MAPVYKTIAARKSLKVPTSTCCENMVVSYTHFASTMPYNIKYTTSHLLFFCVEIDLFLSINDILPYLIYNCQILKNYNKKYADKRTFSRQADSFTLSTRELLEHFFSFSIPISMNHFCLTIISSLETMLIPFMLEIFFHSHSQALETYGTLTGMALPFLFFPATIVNSLSVMLMPAISSAYDQKQHRQMENTISASLHFCLLIGIFSTFAFLIYGTVLGETIFHSKEAGQYVYLFSVL